MLQEIFSNDEENHLNCHCHHEHTDTYEKKFGGDQDDLILLSEPERNLMNIVSPVFVSEQVESSIRTTGGLGKKQCYAFIADRLVNQTKSLYSPISLNKFPLFSQKYLALPSKEKQ